MFLRQLHLINYKNHEKKHFSFNEKIICFVGLNGVGKTNVLDAIYYLCIGKSYFSGTDKQCLNFESDFFRLESIIEKEGDSKQVIVKFEKGKRKKIDVDELPVVKLADHVGKYPIVVVAPNDNILILGGSEERRKYMDEALAQADRVYLNSLNEYQKILVQRNALLKNAEDGNVNKKLLDIYNQQLQKPTEYVFAARKNFINEILPYFDDAYKLIGGNKEKFEVFYKSDLLENPFFDLMQKNLHKDVILQRTTKGIHKDDVEFVMNGEMIKNFGSQGQQKTFLLALKLAQYNYLKSKKNIHPIFLMDDIFDKLDNERGLELLKTVTETLNQVFLTHTDKHVFEKLMGNRKCTIIEI